MIGSKAQDQVQDLLEKFRNLKEEFDRGVGVQTLETVEASGKYTYQMMMCPFKAQIYISVGHIREQV